MCQLKIESNHTLAYKNGERAAVFYLAINRYILFVITVIAVAYNNKSHSCSHFAFPGVSACFLMFVGLRFVSAFDSLARGSQKQLSHHTRRTAAIHRYIRSNSYRAV